MNAAGPPDVGGAARIPLLAEQVNNLRHIIRNGWTMETVRTQGEWNACEYRRSTRRTRSLFNGVAVTFLKPDHEQCSAPGPIGARLLEAGLNYNLSMGRTRGGTCISATYYRWDYDKYTPFLTAVGSRI